MVVSILALVVALGGTGYAAVILPKNSIGSKHIKPSGVSASDLAGGAVMLEPRTPRRVDHRQGLQGRHS